MQRDFQLTVRMAISFLVLTLLYFTFLSFNSINFGLGFIPIALIAGLIISMQWFFSDWMALWSTGTKIVTSEHYKMLHQIVENLPQKAKSSKAKSRSNVKRYSKCIRNW
jgi:Zn-dependent protease with chaperone function